MSPHRTQRALDPGQDQQSGILSAPLSGADSAAILLGDEHAQCLKIGDNSSLSETGKSSGATVLICLGLPVCKHTQSMQLEYSGLITNA